MTAQNNPERERKTPAAAITTKIVPERERMGFLPRTFGRFYLYVEGRVFTYAGRVLRSHVQSDSRPYTGGYWAFRKASNGAGYLVPPAADPARCTLAPFDGITMGCMDEMTADAAGLALTVLAVNHEWHRHPNDDALARAWERLMDVVRTHPERATIGRILD